MRKVWLGMLKRCNRPKSADWLNYGGRGIRVCERWLVYDNFIADMGERPSGMSLDRRDNNGNYEPGNCRWATPLEQANNKSTNKLITAFGRTQTIAQWARETGINYRCLCSRLSYGHKPERALNNAHFVRRKPSRTISPKHTLRSRGRQIYAVFAGNSCGIWLRECRTVSA